MNLYLISRNDRVSWDEYGSAVVATETEEDARNLHPSDKPNNMEDGYYTDWVKPNEVQVKLIGVAIEGTLSGVICASFNAG